MVQPDEDLERLHQADEVQLRPAPVPEVGRRHGAGAVDVRRARRLRARHRHEDDRRSVRVGLDEPHRHMGTGDRERAGGVDEDGVAAVVVGEGRQRGLEGGGRERRGEGEVVVLDLAAGGLRVREVGVPAETERARHHGRFSIALARRRSVRVFRCMSLDFCTARLLVLLL